MITTTALLTAIRIADVLEYGVRVALLVLAVAIAGCAKAPQCKLAPITTTEPVFLWRVYKDADVVWLYGTIHDVGLESVPKGALDALDKSVRLVTELGVTSPDPELFRKYARVRHGPGIDQLLLSSDWYDLLDELRGKIKEEDLKRAAPWYAMSLLTTKLGPKPGPSMDILLGKRAQTLAMPVEALETWELQLDMLNSMVDVSDLQEAIQSRDTMQCDLERMLMAYRASNTEMMTALLVTPRIAETMLYARNRVWLPKIEAYFGKGGAFVAVGLGHMLGDQGLPALFAKAGYTVERTTLR
jgi:uncharacterized protein